MGTQEVRLIDITGSAPARLRLLAPLRYLAIKHPEKRRYDIIVPVTVGVSAWAIYMVIHPKPPLFGGDGLIRFARDLLVMAVPFMVGALAAVAMGSPGNHLDRRPMGAELYLGNDVLTLRQFVCHLLGYLCLLSMVTLFAVVSADLLRNTVIVWTEHAPLVLSIVRGAGTLVLSLLLSFLSVTVLWALYFLTDIVNQKST